jgi:2-oxoglutarate dehydrogenase E2 component (dihydrolipoamide succinyltransferase)
MDELERISGTGGGGRVTKKDILQYKEQKKGGVAVPPQPVSPAPAPFGPAPAAPSASGPAELRQKYPAPAFEIVEMSNIQQRMAEHMVRTVHKSPHTFTVSECDVTKIVEYRAKHAEEFEKREGIKLTYTPFIAEAVARAIKEFPLVNSMVEGNFIITRKGVNLGVAVAMNGGLIVPVVKNADEKNFLGLARGIYDLAARARNKKLLPDEIQGGSFSITNYGVFGNVMGMPLINQPQVAILGVGVFAKRPVVINDGIAIRTISYLTLAFDHRVVDGALGGSFLERVVQLLEEFDMSRVL